MEERGSGEASTEKGGASESGEALSVSEAPPAFEALEELEAQRASETPEEPEASPSSGEAAGDEAAADEEVVSKEEDTGLPVPQLSREKHEQLALEALESGDTGSAFFHWQRAIVVAPEDLRLGTDYRQAVIEAGAYKACIDFFEELAEAYPETAAVRLNLGYAYVDKIPVEGAITAVILANKALNEFSAAIDLESSWLAYYTRGNSYMYWPAIFNRTQLGIADLEKALELAEQLPRRDYHGRAWAALGDGYWRLEDRDKMGEVWQEGAARYPGVPELEERLAREGEELDTWLEQHFETSARVATDLTEMKLAGDLK